MTTAGTRNPDQILSLIKREDARANKGKLKIFLGMAAGVGKTYAMLQVARQVRSAGVDLVVGVVEHHGRLDTALLVDGLEIVPRRHADYKGSQIDEMDLDAVLARRPQVVLVDELAHTNAPGSRHSKRYLDVLELLDAGIDVYTTVNVQHIESRVTTVEDITGVRIHETVPDTVLDRADEIVLIDLPPDELLKRLEEGRIYGHESARVASRNFFKVGNLTALREIALRVAAERVDRDLRDFKTLQGISGVWKAGGRLMVAVFASPYSESLIRWTRRIADSLGLSWIGAYVENDQGYSEEEQRLLLKNIALVQQLGGEVLSTRDNDAVAGLLRLAEQQNVTQIIIGKSQRGFWQSLFHGGSLTSRLIRLSGDIDIYVVATNRAKVRQAAKRAKEFAAHHMRATEIGWLGTMIFAMWIGGLAVEPWIGYRAVGILFLLSVSLAGLILTRSSTLILACILALIHGYSFIPPKNELKISKPEDFMLLLTLFAAAAVVGHLTNRLAQKEKALRVRESRTTVLYNLAREIASAQSVREICKIGRVELERALGMQVEIWLRDQGSVAPKFFNDGGYVLSKKEEAVALWVLTHGSAAGRGTETLSASEFTYIPIVGRSAAVLGVVGANTKLAQSELTGEQLALVNAVLHQVAAGMEREFYHDKAKNAILYEEGEKLYKNLMDCVSHELKTPLAAIKGSASAIIDPLTIQNEQAVRALGTQILDGSNRLQVLVNNLLDMTRIESGHVKPKKVLCEVGDILATALSEVDTDEGAHATTLNLAEGELAVVCDPVLLDQALVNILHNATVHTPPGTAITINAKKSERGEVLIEVRDRGPGLPHDHPQAVFDKFYRADQKLTGGVGLGLAVAKGFIEAQGGRIEAANHPDGGAVFTMYLPKGDAS